MKAIGLIVFLSLTMGCDQISDMDFARDTALDVRAERVVAHSWVGQCAKFDEPMAYLTNLPAGFNYKEKLGSERMLSRKDDAEYLQRTAKDSVVTSIPPDTTFQVVMVYTIVHSGISAMFNSDYEVAVLKDNHGLLSTKVLSGIKACN